MRTKIKVRLRWFKQEIKSIEARGWFFLSLMLFLCFFINIGIHGLAGYFTDNIGRFQPPLWDIAHFLLPVVHEIDFLFEYGLLISAGIILTIMILKNPGKVPYFLFLLNFWFLIRTACACITVLSPPEGVNLLPLPVNFESIWDKFIYGLESKNILFFSGHVGLPYFGAKMFEEAHIAPFKIFGLNINIVKFLKTWAFIMGCVVLLTREHYSIDIVGAVGLRTWIYNGGDKLWHKLFSHFDKIIDKIKQDFEN